MRTDLLLGWEKLGVVFAIYACYGEMFKSPESLKTGNLDKFKHLFKTTEVTD